MEKTLKLSNGVEIPRVGLGTWQTPDDDVAVEAVRAAVAAGYRHIDCAPIYKNEQAVGRGIARALAESGIAREDLFVTSKAWVASWGREETVACCEQTLSDLGMDYLDLYLIHWPASPVREGDGADDINRSTWQGMIDLYEAGKVRAIGVSNFYERHLQPLLDFDVTPMVNQIEYHPGQTSPEVVDFSRAHGMAIEAYSPLGTGKMLANEQLAEIAGRYGRSVAQVCLRWELQNGIIVLPKSTSPERIAQNLDVFDFELSPVDMATIDAMAYCGGSGHHPDTMHF